MNRAYPNINCPCRIEGRAYYLYSRNTRLVSSFQRVYYILYIILIGTYYTQGRQTVIEDIEWKKSIRRVL